ncbi:MAG TPA: hypothetical protein VM432_02255, partial [Bdellovibrionales bacterium]|nr:hypothetical protein [Bdellovibrionales bacterium]
MQSIKFMAMALITAAASLASAGPGSSGGGTGIFCPSPMKTVQLLDLYEGTAMKGYTYTHDAEPYEVQITQMLARLSFDFSVQYPITDLMNEIRSNTVFLPPGVSIDVPGDVLDDGIIVKPSECSLGGIGYYEDDKLYVSSDAFSQLTETEKAAFFMHEAVYARYREVEFLRTSRITYSPRQTRRLIATLVADQRSDEEMRKLSRPMSLEGVNGNKGGNWRIAKGAESRIPFGSYYTPLLVDNSEPLLALSATDFENHDGRVMFHITCPGLDAELTLEDGESQGSLTAKIPKHCDGVSVLLDGPSSHYKVTLDGQDILIGEGNTANGTHFHTRFQIFRKR